MQTIARVRQLTIAQAHNESANCHLMTLHGEPIVAISRRNDSAWSLTVLVNGIPRLQLVNGDFTVIAVNP